MKKTNIVVLIVLVMIICAMAVFTACETTQEENSPVEYTVTFDSNGGSAVKAQTVEQGKKVVLPAEPTKDNCDFLGWYTEDNKPYDFDSAVNANFTLYAKWQEIKPAATYTVTFDANGGSAVKSQEVKEGGKATVPEEPYYEGYDFIGWYTNEDTLYDFDIEVRANLTLTAKWQLKSTPIVFNSWNEVFNVFGEENSYLVEDAFNKIFTEKLFNENNIKNLFGNDMTLADIESGKIEVLKWALEIDDSNNITAVQMLGIRSGVKNENDIRLQSARFVLEKPVSFDLIEGETKVENIIDSEYVVNMGGTDLDFTTFANKLNLSSFSQVYRYSYTPAEGEYLDLFNLLMPYAVSESTQYSHITVSYTKGTSAGYNWAYTFKVEAYNESKNQKESRYIVVEAYDQDESKLVDIANALNNGDWKGTSNTSNLMISGDIILNFENEDEYITINPIQ